MAIQDITGVTTFLGCYVQRATVQFGIGSSPTTVDLDLIQDPPNGYIFNASGATPGNLQRFTWGSLDIAGLVQSCSEHYGPDGHVFNVKIADPRLVLGTVPIILDKFLSNPSGLNFISVLTHYGTPQYGELTPEGMPFRKIRDDIQNSGTVRLYNNNYTIQFTGGFSNSKIPSWYRPNTTQTDINSLANTVAQDFGMDYYANINMATYNPTGTNSIVFNTIDRTQNQNNTISGIIAGWTGSGILQQYNLGKELRTDPTTSLVLGANLTKWDAPIAAQGRTTKSYWGRARDGSALFHFSTPAGGFYPSDSSRESGGYGMVQLDHIVGSYANTKLNHGVARITYEKINIQKVANTGNPYPPEITRTVTTATVTGYYPTNNIMRAALFSQDAWEAVLFHENEIFASSVLSIYESPFLVSSRFVATPNINISLISSGNTINYSKDAKLTKNLITVGTNTITRSEEALQLAGAIYEATRQSADNYMGKSWIVDLPTSTFLRTGIYSSVELIPSIEYKTLGSAWAASGFNTPSGIGNHSSLFYNTNSNLRENNGNIKAFVSFDDYSTTANNLFLIGGAAAGLPFELNTIKDQSYVIDQGGNIVFPIAVEQYELDPDRAITTITETIEGQLPVVGLYSAEPYLLPPGTERFGHFLFALGFTPSQVSTYKLLRHADENKDYGLANPRIYTVTSDGTSQGFFVPLEYQYEYWGPFFSVSGLRNGGVNIISDNSLSPSLYGGYSNFAQAGTDLAHLSVANATYVEAGDFTLVGLPRYNIGDPLGPNNIVSLSTQISYNGGITTNYSLQSFALPALKVSRTLSVGKTPGIFIKNAESVDKVVIGDNTLEAFRQKLGNSFKGFTPYGSLLWNGPGVASFNWLISELSNGN